MRKFYNKRDYFMNYLQIFYMKHHNSKHVIPLNITGCNAPCPLEQFIDLTEDYIPQNWQKECQL